MAEKVILFEEKKDCSGCGACGNACPKGAIFMREDEYGYSYPVIEDDLCIKCGTCKKICGLRNHTNMIEPLKVYALATRDEEAIKKSASGGAFEVMARYVLQRGGVVVGVQLEEEEDSLAPKHCIITDMDDLYKLQGSKYVQSNTGEIYKKVLEYAASQRMVLFSGTPCQNASLRNMLKDNYANVILVDIICHGVPNSRMFKDFIRYRQRRLKAKVKKFYFRDKHYGQGYTTRTVYERDGICKEKICKGELFAYIRFFSKSLTLRESCYNCSFATRKRVSDITIGDYWGFNEEFKDTDKKGLNDELGVSCFLVNSKKGEAFLKELDDNVVKIESSYDMVLKHNKQLNAPTKMPQERELILEAYKNNGYVELERLYWTKWFGDKIKYIISSGISKNKRIIKNMFT